jgi:hypothetical protein
MPGLFSNVGSAITNTYSAWRRVYSDPTQVQGGKTITRYQWYNLLWAYYTNSAFEYIPNWGNQWGSYKQAYRLYRQIRSIYNPTSRLVDFYASQIYPGVLTIDSTTLPPGVQSAIPFAEDTDPALIAAIAQVWRWSNWQSTKSKMIRYAGATGNALVEVVDDLERGEVFLDVVWPGLVKYLDLSPSGDVRGFTLEYGAVDDDAFTYTYRREVTPDTFKTFKNGSPFGYNGDPAVYPNPYGFVPAVWVKHRDGGGDYGAPVIHGSIGKIDELNSLASHIHDHIHRVIASPNVFWSKGDINKMFQTNKRPASEEMADPEMDRDNVLMLKGPEGGRVESLIKDLNITDAFEGLDRLVAEIEADHPELAMYKELRSMSQVTGPAANRLLGDVVQIVSEAASSYDLASTHLFQMSVAIGGFRANSGDWTALGPLSTHQQAFLPFDLSSYGEGALDLQIMPRPLIPITESEELDLEIRRKSLLTPPTVAENISSTD